MEIQVLDGDPFERLSESKFEIEAVDLVGSLRKIILVMVLMVIVMV